MTVCCGLIDSRLEHGQQPELVAVGIGRDRACGWVDWKSPDFMIAWLQLFHCFRPPTRRYTVGVKGGKINEAGREGRKWQRGRSSPQWRDTGLTEHDQSPGGASTPCSCAWFVGFPYLVPSPLPSIRASDEQIPHLHPQHMAFHRFSGTSAH